jgi:hypothetical protein
VTDAIGYLIVVVIPGTLFLGYLFGRIQFDGGSPDASWIETLMDDWI